ncbi:unnamed protein product [Leptidea sinapis]|uniref:Uncharacterized protein n=1 Tax=Leptidea sinapis TaxID=189913 RepID=A0A5E4PV58_9NEOP|nr:unnamed protein product [Leptidea sinapis]
MAPGNKERHPNHTGTIPKTKVRNNCNVPQEAVTPTRRDMASNLVTTSLDWVPVSEYNPRRNSNQSRKQTNNTSDQELIDLDNSVTFESGLGRFVPVRPQPRAHQPTAQNREHINSVDLNDDASSSGSHSLHPYTHQMQNGLIPHSNHAAAAVMIVNPTTPNAVAGNITQSLNNPNYRRKNLIRNLNLIRSNHNMFEGNINTNNNNAAPSNSNPQNGTKTINVMNNMYDQGLAGFSNSNESNHSHRESARALGEAIAATCPDAEAVERRLGQIREYIRVTSTLVDTMRNSEDEAFIEHTKEEYDELLQMIMKLRESEKKLENLLLQKTSDMLESLAESDVQSSNNNNNSNEIRNQVDVQDNVANQGTHPHNVKNNNDSRSACNSHLKKVTNLENQQLNKNLMSKPKDEVQTVAEETIKHEESHGVEIEEIESRPYFKTQSDKDDQHLNEVLRKNITSCVEKIAIIEEIKNKAKDSNTNNGKQVLLDVVVRPVSVQSNASAYSDNELWQNEIKNKVERSQMRLNTLKQQQKRLLKYQQEAKQQLEELNKERHNQEMHQPSTSHESFNGMQNMSMNANYIHPNRMYAANQIGVATTLQQNTDGLQMQIANNVDSEQNRSRSNNTQEERFLLRDHNIVSNEGLGGGRDSEAEEDEGDIQERGLMLQQKLRELQMKKQHMENVLTEFKNLRMSAGLGESQNTYSSSGEDSGDEEASGKCNKPVVNLPNEDPFKAMEIKAIKAALQKTQDLMRSVDTFEADLLSGVRDESYLMPSHSNLHDNKSEGGGSMGGWSNDGSMYRVMNALPQRHKFTNEQQLQQQQLPIQQHHNMEQNTQQSHEANLNSLQELANELRMETEKIIGERARIKELVTSKEVSRKQKKVNEEGGARGTSPGPSERRQRQLRALLADKQRELEELLNKQVKNTVSEATNATPDALEISAINQSYNSEQEEVVSHSENIQMDTQNLRDGTDNFRGGGDSVLGARSINTAPSQLASTYCSDTDSASRVLSNQRGRTRRRPTQDRLVEDTALPQQNTSSPNTRHEPRMDTTNVNAVPPVMQNIENATNVQYPYHPPPAWNAKSNQDMRTNQFTQNSQSQTMDRLMTSQIPFPTMPFNMMMPYGMMCGCSCGCSAWGAWCWHQLALHQREIHQLRDQLDQLEARWRSEPGSHTLNNQVPPGNRANNYWDNFRSYSRQNLLSTNSKTNADSHLGVGPPHNPHPLVDRSHNTLNHISSSSTSPSVTPKRNTNVNASSHPVLNQPNPDIPAPIRASRRNVSYERSLSFSSAPDVLNLNQHSEEGGPPRNADETNATTSNVNRPEPAPNALRNTLNISNPIPEIIQAHSNNLNVTKNSKKKSSSKLPSKNSANRRNYNMLDYSQISNVNIASTSEPSNANPNLASTSREIDDKATSKLFDLLRENIYSEVTNLIGVNESHPDFLIQLFKELKYISSDPLRQKVLNSVRNILSQYCPAVDSQMCDTTREDYALDTATTSQETNNVHETHSEYNGSLQMDNRIVRFLLQNHEEVFTIELLKSLVKVIVDNPADKKHNKKIFEMLMKYESMRVCDVSSEIISNLSLMMDSNDVEESTNHTSEMSESSILQDVAGSLNLFSSSETQLHQINTCPYDMWSTRVQMDIDNGDINDNNQEGKVDLLNCSEMHNGDLAEADQTCRSDISESLSNRQDESQGNAEALPDVVDNEEVTPTEAEAEWLGLDRVPTRLHMEDSSEKQKGDVNIL